MRELRKVTYKSYITVNRPTNLKVPKVGWFHQFVEDPIYEDERYFSRTIAIIEDFETGQIYNVFPDQLQFEI